jgi:hypothetical protein
MKKRRYEDAKRRFTSAIVCGNSGPGSGIKVGPAFGVRQRHKETAHPIDFVPSSDAKQRQGISAQHN